MLIELVVLLSIDKYVRLMYGVIKLKGEKCVYRDGCNKLGYIILIN